MLENESFWILCTVCTGKTRTKIRKDSELKNFPLYCPKCKREFLINVEAAEIEQIKEPDAQTQSR
ncbi:cysteine-rich KTR domain-containing protein [Enterococcus sp. LJL128]